MRPHRGRRSGRQACLHLPGDGLDEVGLRLRAWQGYQLQVTPFRVTLLAGVQPDPIQLCDQAKGFLSGTCAGIHLPELVCSGRKPCHNARSLTC